MRVLTLGALLGVAVVSVATLALAEIPPMSPSPGSGRVADVAGFRGDRMTILPGPDGRAVRFLTGLAFRENNGRLCDVAPAYWERIRRSGATSLNRPNFEASKSWHRASDAWFMRSNGDDFGQEAIGACAADAGIYAGLPTRTVGNMYETSGRGSDRIVTGVSVCVDTQRAEPDSRLSGVRLHFGRWTGSSIRQMRRTEEFAVDGCRYWRDPVMCGANEVVVGLRGFHREGATDDVYRGLRPICASVSEEGGGRTGEVRRR